MQRAHPGKLISATGMAESEALLYAGQLARSGAASEAAQRMELRSASWATCFRTKKNENERCAPLGASRCLAYLLQPHRIRLLGPLVVRHLYRSLIGFGFLGLVLS